MQRTFKQSLLVAALALSFGTAMAQEAPPIVVEAPITTPAVMPEVGAEAPVTVAPGAEAAEGGAVRTQNASRSSNSSEADTTSSSTVAMEWTGGGRLDAEATANTSTTQSSTDNVSSNLDRSPNRATIESGAGAGVSGNIGINFLDRNRNCW